MAKCKTLTRLAVKGLTFELFDLQLHFLYAVAHSAHVDRGHGMKVRVILITKYTHLQEVCIQLKGMFIMLLVSLHLNDIICSLLSVLLLQ